MPSYTQWPHPCRVFATESHDCLRVPHRIVEPAAGARLPCEAAVVECEGFRNPPPVRGLRDHGALPRHQLNASLKAPDFDISEPHARHCIRLRLDDIAGDLLDPARAGRCDPPRPQPTGDGIAPSRRSEGRDRRGIERRATDAAGRIEIDCRQRIEQFGRLPAERRPHVPASSASRATALPERESPSGATVLLQSAGPRSRDRGSAGVRSLVRMHAIPRERRRAPAARRFPRRDAARPGSPKGPGDRLRAAGSAERFRHGRLRSVRCRERHVTRGRARTPRNGRRAPLLRYRARCRSTSRERRAP